MGSAKPLDVGNGQLVASFAASRPALLSVSCYHQAHGIAELSAAPPFDESRRGQPDEVRRYREVLASDDFACLDLVTDAGQTITGHRVDAGEALHPRWHGAIDGRPFSGSARADADALVIALDPPDGASGLHLRFRGRIDRPALAEITELDPPSPTGAVASLETHGSRLLVRSSLPASIAIDVGLGEWRADEGGATLDVSAGRPLTVRISTPDNLPPGRPRPTTNHADAIVTRALAYTRNCTTIATGADEAVILTDHRLLPLSWTRDAYYQALMLLATGEQADADLVADHLRWLWRRCVRPAGRWLRSHHANGRPKDVCFQADQQLYPLLELADYWRARGALPDGVDWPTEIDRAWRAVLAEVDERSGLMATAENAADDPISVPFVAASQVLLWSTAQRMAELADAGVGGLRIDARGLRDLATTVRAAFDRHFVSAVGWAYATDGRGTIVRYHDANDLPVALAPMLGFCAASDEAWRMTMDFAFSAANPGFFAGELAGLGSAHTPAPWALGDVQAWIRARVTGHGTGAAAASRRLHDVAFHDAMLPEAYSAVRSDGARVRRWFAWPGAAYAAFVLLDERDELGRLTAR